ncbi:hypothetical protein [Actinoplanes derwentensis]|uniref:Regulatory protein, tetR family n=1 Tax=Actinoplanes derwentensis TaxID=113562 RepID=A0A1H1R498_9ACTN|nr:hypothetical protein [Actinoplanes derwentensis]GID88011.1 hypothetical protein Ade03nite_69350 [Actinoplanes derwentensis]SDS30588.1 hypothetical protein SAMN04489716_0491 [Actinoplanes derwentensis]
MPKQIDHEQRRRLLADAVFAAIGAAGFESVSLRDVAERSGLYQPSEALALIDAHLDRVFQQ